MNIGPYREETPPRRELIAGGAVLLSVPVPAAHAVALGVWLRRGSQDEPPGLGGLSHFLEHIVFKGSTTRSAYELAAGFDAIGAAVDAFTTKDHVAFTLKVLPEYIDPAAELLADMLLRPALEPEPIALEQQVVCEEIQEARDTPEDHLHDAFAARVFGTHPRGLPILGTRESVLALDAGILRREHRRLCAGPNVVIAIAGSLTGGVREAVLRHFTLPPAGEATTAAQAPAAGAGGNGGSLRLDLKGPLVQSYFEIGNLACSYRHADRIPLVLLANILGGGMSSRIFQAVREREGLAYTVYTYSDMGRDTGLVSCAGSCSPSKAQRLEAVVRDEYARLLRDGVSEAELESNRAQIKSQIVFSLEGVSNLMARAAKNELYYGRFVPVAELVDEIDSLDGDALMRCARAYFDPERLIVATHGPQ